MTVSSVAAFCLIMISVLVVRDSAYAGSVSHCETLARIVASQAGNSDAAFIRSYEPGEDQKSLPLGLASTAFVYDNALAVIALIACGDKSNATIIGNALSIAVRSDRTFTDGRVRNAYRAGPIGKGPPALPGWWDAKDNIWAEDPAQDGTSTGNVAWAALALLTLNQVTTGQPFLTDAERLIDWIIQKTSTGRGFKGGLHGYDPHQVDLTWMSTEHNVDVYAAASWLLRLTGERRYADAASKARGFVGMAFDENHFLLGTEPDGRLADPAKLALDVQLWPWMAIGDGPAEWLSALKYAADHLSVADGFDFDGDRDGVWVEGSAQASLAYRIAGDLQRSLQLLVALDGDRSASGLLFATRSPRVSTGLSVDPTTTEPDFFYFKRPHLGATAWAALAAMSWNPFTGKRVD